MITFLPFVSGVLPGYYLKVLRYANNNSNDDYIVLVHKG